MTDDLLTATMTVADHELDDPAVHTAARAVIDDLASIPRSLTPPRRQGRRAVAAAAAVVALAAGIAGYALTAGGSSKTELRETAVSAGGPGQAAPSAPADVCRQVTAWLEADLAAADPAGTDQDRDVGRARAALALAQLEGLRDLALDAGDEGLARRIEVFMATAQSGDRLATEASASEGFGGDACA
ncbi:MAG TPA: hypothetical protein VFB94_22480 [Acidimicrobiales bacterium]|nr:hypothetical protein [Acidimicrobiales bacterium]